MDALNNMTTLQMIAVGFGVTFIATAFGALPALFIRQISERTKDLFLGISAGVMLAATAFSLIEPSVGLFQDRFSILLTSVFCGSMVLLGGYVIHLGNRFIPHEHFLGNKNLDADMSSATIKKIWLFVFAIAIHNVPEGFAVGTAIGSGDSQISLPILLGIGFQDIPEGLVVALALRALGYSTKDSFMVAGVTGVIEGVAAIVGVLAVVTIQTILPWTLAFSGGMMLYVVSHEMIPESHRNGYEKHATAGLMVGFVLMMLLDVLLK